MFILIAIIGAVILLLFRKLWRTDECTVLQTIRSGDAHVEIVDDRCKEGLPHTTDPDTIRMTRAVWEGPRRDAVMTHERVHLAQRRTGEAWRDFYSRAWGYVCSRTPPGDIPADYVARLRPNPDTADTPWATWRDRYVFFPAFTVDGTLQGAEVIVWDLENHRQVGIPEAWKAEFCGTGACPHQYEHPHEISAEWLSAPTRPDTSAARKLFAWNK
jgi:hypothetical protein